MSKRNCIIIILGCVVVYFLLVAFCLSESLQQRVAEDPTLKGKGKDSACMDYAIALSSRLASNGIHGQLIFYRWHIRDTGTEGSHVFVAYHLADGSEWIVENEPEHPKAVPADASRMQLVYLLSGTENVPVDVKLQEGLNELSYF